MSAARRVLITGLAGQDGLCLARWLLGRGYQVVGISRRPPPPALLARVRYVPLDITDTRGLQDLVAAVQPEECYHLAAYHTSSQALGAADDEEQYLRVNLGGTHALLRAVRRHAPACRFFFSSSCHVFGEAPDCPQNESTPRRPSSMYALSKAAAEDLVRLYRDRHGLFGCIGILYNHESALRGETFITARLARSAVEAGQACRREVRVGRLDAAVDWSHAQDVVRAMWLALQAAEPEDYVVGSGVLRTVRDFAQMAFERVGLDWSRYVIEDASQVTGGRPTIYQADITKLRTKLGFAHEIAFESLVAEMVDHYRSLLSTGTEGRRES